MMKEAIKDEIDKGENSDDKNIKISSAYIKNKIYPKLDFYLNKYNDTFATIFKSLYETFKKEDLTIFTKTLDNIMI